MTDWVSKMDHITPPKLTGRVIYLTRFARSSKALSGERSVKRNPGLGKKSKPCKMGDTKLTSDLPELNMDKDPTVLTFEANSVLRDLAARGAPLSRGDGLDDVSMAEVSRFSRTQLMTSFGSRLREARKEARRTLEDVCKVVGRTRQTVAGWELMGVAPDSLSESKKEALANYLGVRYEWLSANAGPMREEASQPSAAQTQPAADSVPKDELRDIAKDLRKVLRRIEDLSDE